MPPRRQEATRFGAEDSGEMNGAADSADRSEASETPGVKPPTW